MRTRSASWADAAAIAELQRRLDVHWFGRSEQSESETRERLAHITSFADDSLLVFSDGALVGAGLRWLAETSVLVDPGVDRSPVYGPLLAWVAAGRPTGIDVLSRDELLRGLVDNLGWVHTNSSFEMFTEATPELPVAAPHWPSGIVVTDYRADLAEVVYRLLYVEAGWAEVPGHPHRDFAQWQQIFIGDHTLAERQTLAWRGDRLVGVAMGRTWDDGTGWVSQLAVAKDERGRGLGRALLYDSLGHRIASGATALGLSVSAVNRTALRMYLDAGLQVDREWMEYVAPGPTARPETGP